MNFISDILYWISTGLLVPVIVLLIILFCRALLLAGSFYGQYMSIRKTEALLRNELGKLTSETVGELNSKLPEKSRSLVIMYMRQVLDARDTPALAGLASGDIASMAYNMQIAFATTVVGLVAGAVGFLTQQVKQRWYLQDMTNLEFIAELLNENRTTKTTEK